MDKDKKKKSTLLATVTDRLTQLFRHEKAPADTPPATHTARPQAATHPADTSTPKRRVYKRRTHQPHPGTKMETATPPPPLYELEQHEIPTVLRTYIEAHIADTSLSVTSMAADFKTSRTGLYTVMHQAFGMTPGNYITQVRMEHAVQLLMIGIKASTVASRCGYADPKYFGKTFKKRYGVLPSHYAQPDTQQ